MSYDILAKDGRPIKKDGDPVKAMDYTVEKIEQLDDSLKTFIAVASTEDEDRDKDIIRQDGWDLKNFKKNPMVPWSHNYWGIPIGKSLKTWVDKESKKLLFKPQFDVDDEDSMKIFNKYKNGFLKSFSVGFRGVDFKYRDEDDRWWGGIEFLEQELLEISAVTIPANPNATVSLNGADDAAGRNLMQLGYASHFAKTDSGLFYPIRQQLAEYHIPEVKEIDDVEGVRGVYALSLESDMIQLVGYYFDPEKWETPEIQKWVKENNEPTYKQFYYKWTETDKDFEVNVEEEEVDLPVYDELKVLTTGDFPVGVPGHDKPDVCPVPNADNDKNKDVEKSDNNKGDINNTEKTLDDYLKEINTVFEKNLGAISNGMEKAVGKILGGLLEIKSLLNEKIIDSDENVADNKSNDDLASDDDDKHDSKSDDDIELDDSLLSPGKDKTNDDDMIELDDDLLSDKENAKAAVKSVFSEKLRETLKEVRDSFKIEI
jgi:HK97 family phage prohead protease